MKKIVVLIFLYLAYSLLSYVLLLRDEWAILSIKYFYPSVGNIFANAREYGLDHHLNTIPTIIYFLIIFLVFINYWKIIRSNWIKKQSVKSIFYWSLVFQIIIIFSYPALSSDVFDYIMSNRVLAVYGQNPWITSSINFPNDPFINLGNWQRIPSVYGPLHHLISYPLALISGNDLIISVLSFKIVAVIFTLVTAVLLVNLLPRKNLSQNLSLFLFNPLLIIEFSGQAHNDIIMVTMMVAALLTFRKRKNFLTGLLIGLGTLLKIYSFVFLPLFAFLLISKRKVKNVIFLSIGFFITIFIGLVVMGTDSLHAQRKVMEWVFTLGLNSLPNALNSLPWLPFEIPFKYMYLVFFPFLVYYLVKIKNQQNLIISYIKLTLIYLMFILSLYWSWYVVWYLPFLSLVNIPRLTKTAITFSMTSLLYYAILFLSHRFNYENPLWTIIIYLFLVAPPIAVYLKGNDAKAAK